MAVSAYAHYFSWAGYSRPGYYGPGFRGRGGLQELPMMGNGFMFSVHSRLV